MKFRYSLFIKYAFGSRKILVPITSALGMAVAKHNYVGRADGRHGSKGVYHLLVMLALRVALRTRSHTHAHQY